jgi:hypothetical protein
LHFSASGAQKHQKTFLKKVENVHKKKEKIPCRIFRILFLAVLDVSLHGEFKNSKSIYRKKYQKPQKTHPPTY